MIIGLGIDLVEVARLEEALNRHGERFAERILSVNEYPSFMALPTGQQARFLAKRFAVKEAFSKAAGTGIGRGFGFHDVWLIHDALGKPQLQWSARVDSVLDLQAVHSHVSVTDERTHASAVVVLERGAAPDR